MNTNDCYIYTQPVLTPLVDRYKQHISKGIMLFDSSFSYTAFDGTKRIDRCIQANSVYDGASIPRILWPIIGHPFSSRFWRAAAIHDDLYTIKHNRSAADRIFLNELRKAGVSAFKARLMWLGVRAGGWVCYVDTGKWYNKLAYKLVMGWKHKPRPWYSYPLLKQAGTAV